MDKIILSYDQKTEELNIENGLEPNRRTTQKTINILASIKFDKEPIDILFKSIRNKLLKNKDRITSLPVAIDIYNKLDDEVDVENLDEIKVVNKAENKYAPIIKDFADNNGIETNFQIKQHRNQIVLSALPTILLASLVQIPWSIYNKLSFSGSNSDTVFFYGPGRFENKSSILNSAENNDEMSHQFVSKGIKPTQFLPSNVLNHDPVSLGSFTRMTDFAHGIKILIQHIFPEIIINKNIDKKIVGELEKEFEYDLSTTIKTACTCAYNDLNFQIFPKYASARAVIERTECNNVVVGSLSSLNEAILSAAAEQGANQYHTPNGVVNENIWDPEYTHFVSGTSAQHYIEEQMGIDDASMYIPTGRPNLSNLCEEYKNSNVRNKFPENDKSLNILLATQPHTKDHRQQFVRGVMDACEQLSNPISITIKIHPLEEIKFYQKYREDSGVTVSDGDLFEHIKDSHLVVMPNSNVGLESIIIGTPSISYIPSPDIIKPDIEQSPIPVFNDSKSMKKWLLNLNRETHNKLVEEQTQYIENNHQLEPNAEERIVDYIINRTNEE